MKVKTDAELLATSRLLLNCPNLAPEWYLDYGITAARAAALLAASVHPDSLGHPGSETALTLFGLGNLDGWSQAGYFNPSPRDELSPSQAWSRPFFEQVREGNVRFDRRPEFTTAWWDSPFQEALLKAGAATPTNTVLLFEFEVMNAAFHTTGGQAFKSLSFFNLRTKRECCQYDVVLLLPTMRRFVFIEAKLGSDLSDASPATPSRDQVIRGLEAAYFLTRAKNSLYLGWDFSYVLLCPPASASPEDQKYARYQDPEGGGLKEALAEYKELLRSTGAPAVLPERMPLWQDFWRTVRKRFTCIEWPAVFQACDRGTPGLLPQYLQRLRAAGFADHAASVSSRLAAAGVDH